MKKCIMCGLETEFSVTLWKHDFPMCLHCQGWMRRNPIEANSVIRNGMEKLNELENSQHRRSEVGE